MHSPSHACPPACLPACRLPAGVLSCELSCIRDTLPPQLTQLTALQRLVVRQGEVSEGVLLIEHECLSQLTGERYGSRGPAELGARVRLVRGCSSSSTNA